MRGVVVVAAAVAGRMVGNKYRHMVARLYSMVEAIQRESARLSSTQRSWRISLPAVEAGHEWGGCVDVDYIAPPTSLDHFLTLNEGLLVIQYSNLRSDHK